MSAVRPQIGCYYFPNYHLDRRNIDVHGEGWTEWEVVKHATPRFPGHQQPRIPVWGYADEAAPAVMAQKIDVAADHGVDFFIFDWYYYDDGPFLERALDEGYLRAPNNDRVKFCCMWANHNWSNIHPCGLNGKRELLYPGTVTPETFRKVCRLAIERYFSHPSHYQVNGCPYFSFYSVGDLLAGFGSVTAVRKALDEFRAMAVTAGFPGLHLNAIVCAAPILPGEKIPADFPALIDALGFDSITSYNWVSYGGMTGTYTPYRQMQEHYFGIWDKSAHNFHVPYIPNVTVGWDTTPRTIQSDIWNPDAGYPYMPLINENTPEAFRHALEATKDRLAQYDIPQIITINSWNEWTEGSYLEPDNLYGMGYLESLKTVFVQ